MIGQRAPRVGAAIPLSAPHPPRLALGRRGAWRPALRGALPVATLALATAVFCWKLLVGGLVVIGYDTMTYMYPYRYFAAAALREGRLPLWNPYIYYGVPFLANLQAAVFYPLHALFLALPATWALNWSVAGHLFLAAAAAYVAARRIAALDRLSAFVAGAVYGLGGFVGAQVGHLNQLNAAAWLPLALVALDLALRRGELRWVAATAAVLAVQLLAGHAQESYMTLALLGAYAAYFCAARAWQLSPTTPGGPGGAALWAAARRPAAWGREAVRAGAILGGAGLLAAGIAAAQLLPTNELAGHSIRAAGMSFGEATSFSLAPRELFVSLLPTFGLAGPTSNEYLGWVGVGGLTLALLGVLCRWNHPATAFFAVVGAGSFLLALGNHFPLYELAFRLPGMHLFRVPARWLLLTSFSLAMLAGSGLAFVAQLGRRQLHGLGGGAAPPAGTRRWSGPWQHRSAVTRLLLAVAVVGAAAGALWPFQRLPAGAPAAALAALWLALAAGVVGLAYWGFAAGPSRWPARILALWVVCELFLASRSLEYNNPNPEFVYTAARPVLDALRRDPRPERVLSIAATGYHPSDADQLVAGYQALLGSNGVLATLINTKYKETLNPNLSMVYGIPTIDGYDGGVLPLRRYVEYKRLLVPPEQNLPDALLRDQVRNIPDMAKLRLFGVKYVLADAIGDVTRDGVFYDLSATVTLAPGGSVRLYPVAQDTSNTGAPPDTQPAGAGSKGVGPIRAIGIVTSLEGAAAAPDGAPAGVVALGQGTQARARTEIIAGRDTAEAAYGAAALHTQPPTLPRPGAAGAGAAASYLATLAAPVDEPVEWVSIQNTLAAGRLRVEGLTLIGGPAQSDAAAGPGGAAGAGPADTTQAPPQVWPVSLAGGGAVRLVHRSDVKLYRNDSWLPRAYVVRGSRLVADAGEALVALREAGYDPERSVVLERDPGPPRPPATRTRALLRAWRDGAKEWLGIRHDPRAGTVGAADAPAASPVRPPAAAASDARGPAAGAGSLPPAQSVPAGGTEPAGRGGSVEWLSEAPERLVLRVEAPGPGILVLRDTFYPGWTATVDGVPAPLWRADALFRAVPVPAGSHVVEFRLQSRALERGLLLSAVALLATTALALLPLGRRPWGPYASS